MIQGWRSSGTGRRATGGQVDPDDRQGAGTRRSRKAQCWAGEGPGHTQAGEANPACPWPQAVAAPPSEFSPGPRRRRRRQAHRLQPLSREGSGRVCSAKTGKIRRPWMSHFAASKAQIRPLFTCCSGVSKRQNKHWLLSVPFLPHERGPGENQISHHRWGNCLTAKEF